MFKWSLIYYNNVRFIWVRSMQITLLNLKCPIAIIFIYVGTYSSEIIEHIKNSKYNCIGDSCLIFMSDEYALIVKIYILIKLIENNIKWKLLSIMKLICIHWIIYWNITSDLYVIHQHNGYIDTKLTRYINIYAR